MRALSIALSLALLCATTDLRANPNQAEPFAPLDIHGAEFSPELSATAQQLYQQSRALLTKMEGQFNNKRLASIDLKDVGKTYMGLLRLRRIGAQLSQLGEPAGADFTRRGDEMMQSLNRIIGALKLLPNAPQVINNLATRGQQVSQNYSRQIPKLQKLAQQEKWSEAEKELYEILDELEQYSVFVNNDQSLAIYLPFRDVAAIITQGSDQERKATAQKLLTDRRAALRPDLPKLLADLNAATVSVAKTGQHTIAGQELTGPELIAHFDNAWRQAHVATMKALGVE
ncbi:MAG TPA: hypothetical protein VL096_04085, partial [Pirellulaceae bacterium]|nr:hypothetical protein [Pirellulaceae bacterium]